MIALGLASATAVYLLFWGEIFWRKRQYLLGLLVGLGGAATAALVVFALAQQ